MLIAPLLAPQPGERLLDACAAPGGKTTHLAALTGNRAKITALDLHPQRLRLVEQGAARLGCSGITARSWDMTLFPPFLPPQSCDGVLVDAPCSGLGVLRRNPEARWRLQPADVVVLAERQAMILNQAAALVKPGGHLFFSTINRNPKAFLFAIVGAEYVLNLLPKGTHDYEKFIRPAELAAWVRAAGLTLTDMTGMTYNPLTRIYQLRPRDVSVNYMIHAQKAAI
jgi:2-polyprenyl-3-methyl-5-hydroxy-6-metoxy-1,4-benzoquinol methylase